MDFTRYVEDIAPLGVRMQIYAKRARNLFDRALNYNFKLNQSFKGAFGLIYFD